MREFLDEKDEVGRAHLEKVIKLLERSEFPRIWAQGEDYVSSIFHCNTIKSQKDSMKIATNSTEAKLRQVQNTFALGG